MSASSTKLEQPRVPRRLADATPLVSMITTCKGRLRHLKQSLPLMLGQSTRHDFEVIVVDFGCPDRTFDWCQTVDHPNLIAMRVLDNVHEFNAARARNCGVHAAAGPILAFVDADVLADRRWLNVAVEPVVRGQVGLTRVHNWWQNSRDLCGTCVVSREVYDRVRGYDESFRGWGVEDCDFYRRCRQERREVYFQASLLRPIPRSDEDRVRYRAGVPVKESYLRNEAYLASRTGPVNPGGYGTGWFEIFRSKSGRTETSAAR